MIEKQSETEKKSNLIFEYLVNHFVDQTNQLN